MQSLLADFSDNNGSVPAADFDTLVYIDVGGSVDNFYEEVSYNTLTLSSSTWPSAMGWIRAPQTYSYYVNDNYGVGFYPFNSQKLVEDIVDAIDGFIDFSQYDNNGDGSVDGLIIAHAGPGAEFTGDSTDIWSHKWSISPRPKDGVFVENYSINPEYWSSPGDITLGVYCHELGHIFGLPDLYDTDYSSYGIDDWSLMAGGSWNGPSYMGGSPAHPDAWSRIFLGFAAPIVPVYDQSGISFPRVETNAVIYKLWTSGSPLNEYFLVENRQKTGYDTYLPGAGLLIWHIDDNQAGNTNEWWPGSGNPGHYKVALVQADNLWELEQQTGYADNADPYPGNTVNRTFSGSSSPSSNAYSGTGTSVSVVSISNSGAVMTADIAVGSPQSISAYGDLLPGKIKVLGNFPNPFNPETAIRFEVFKEAHVKLEIFDITGRKIRTLDQRTLSRGIYAVFWDGSNEPGNDVGSGVYFYRITVDDSSISRKMLKLN
jgi:immune inhibitor A